LAVKVSTAILKLQWYERDSRSKHGKAEADG
jgi:hypothetical protein